MYIEIEIYKIGVLLTWLTLYCSMNAWNETPGDLEVWPTFKKKLTLAIIFLPEVIGLS